MLRMKAGLSFREIAEVERCPINTVLGRMHNAKARLKNAFASQDPAGSPKPIPTT